MADLNGDATTLHDVTETKAVNPHSPQLTNGTNGAAKEPAHDQNDEHAVEHTHNHDDPNAGVPFQISVTLPHMPYKMSLTVTSQEQVQDVRQMIIETPDTFQYTCFHLEHNGVRVSDFVELSEVKDLKADSELVLFEDPYTERDARMHIVRIRDLIGAAGKRTDLLHGVCAGASLHDSISHDEDKTNGNADGTPASRESPLASYEFDAPPELDTILPRDDTPLPKTLKALSISPWNPPPYQMRQRGHLMYLLLTTNEGEQHQITCAVSGFFVNKCSNNKFDPFPRPAPKNYNAHSLLTLTAQLSPGFDEAFVEMQKINGQKDLLTIFPFQNAIPANPWLIPATSGSSALHHADPARAQETYLLGGGDGSENLRDWNEEFQTTRELPRESVQDRVFRERLTSKLFADYNDAAARGAILVARGEVAPLNPTEGQDAQIFIHNNIFFSFGADGVQTFASEGGDEAARVAVGKDVAGVKAVNQLDIHGLYTPGTVVVDYLGKRIVGQSIVPGIFKQREPGEHQIDYGGVEGREIVTENEEFVPVFEKLSKALRVKKHAVWDKEGKRHDLEGSVETKGLLGTDGRKYVLDLYRITPLDVAWSEEVAATQSGEDDKYPHSMAILRPELVESYWRMKMQEYVKTEVEKRRAVSQGANDTSPAVSSTEEEKGTKDSSRDAEGETDDALKLNGNASIDHNEGEVPNGNQTSGKDEIERVDISNFNLALNSDVFSGQVPQTDEEKAQYAEDEKDVREVCDYLRSKVIPGLLSDLLDSDVGFPMDGQSLSQLLHKRGINLRYLGKIATLAAEKGRRLEALRRVAVQDMTVRAFKHVLNRYLRHLPSLFAPGCVSHLLNCFLGAAFNPDPKPELDEDMQKLYSDGDFSYTKVTPATLKADLEKQIKSRYRYSVTFDEDTKYFQVLREVSLRLGLQLAAKDYTFAKADLQENQQALANGDAIPAVNDVTHEERKKKKKKVTEKAHVNGNGIQEPAPTTFVPDDIINIAPIVKDAAPKSAVAEEALEAGRISLAQNQKQLGQELVLESLSLHEQIYGFLHPEVAKAYQQLSMIYYQIEEKEAAVELARKAVIVTERTIGIDSHEAVLAYLNLSLFEHHMGNTTHALRYVRHALDVWKIIYGRNHPDSITTMNNAGVMLQSLQKYSESRRWFEACFAVCEETFGMQSVNSATILFQLAQALALDGDAKGAVIKMRDAYNIFLSELGKDDRNTKEAENWLEQLTQNAVNIAKMQAKDLQNRRFRRIQFQPRTGPGMAIRPQPSPLAQGASGANTNGAATLAATGANAHTSKPATVSTNGHAGLDSRSIDELLKWIEGDTTTSTRSNQKKRKAVNPKLRRAQEASPAAATA